MLFAAKKQRSSCSPFSDTNLCCVCTLMHTVAHLWRSENNLWKLVLSFHHRSSQMSNSSHQIIYSLIWFAFSRQGFTVWPLLSWNLSCKPGCPQTQRSISLCLLSVEIKVVHHYHPASMVLVRKIKTQKSLLGGKSIQAVEIFTYSCQKTYIQQKIGISNYSKNYGGKSTRRINCYEWHHGLWCQGRLPGVSVLLVKLSAGRVIRGDASIVMGYKMGKVVHACNPSIEAKIGGLWKVPGQPRLQRKTLSQTLNKESMRNG